MADRPNLWNEVAALIEAAGLDVSDVQSIDVTPHKVAFTVALRDEQGHRYAVGNEVAADTLTFSCNPHDPYVAEDAA